MPRATKTAAARLLKAKARQAVVRVSLAEIECKRAEQARDNAHRAVTAAYVELGRALLAGEIGDALRFSGRK